MFKPFLFYLLFLFIQVAIKIISKESISDVEDIDRVYRETFILTTLKHPNIIKLYEVSDGTNSYRPL